ncbi:MAG: hypothetical protein ACF8XB_25715 [Planctomycetota bacterium JB042]
MRHLISALCTCLALAACADAPSETEADRAEWTAAVRLQDQGRLDDALARYRDLARTTESEALAAKAALEIGRIEVALVERDRALERLAALPGEVDVRLPADVEREIDAIADRFEETAFAEVVSDRAVAARQEVRRRHEERRALERGAVDELLARGEFSAALDLLRRVESKRTEDDRRDVAEMLASVRTASEAAADALLADLDSRAEADPAAAAAWLAERMGPFRGTRAYARLLSARLALRPPPAGETPAEEGAADDG